MAGWGLIPCARHAGGCSTHALVAAVLLRQGAVFASTDILGTASLMHPPDETLLSHSRLPLLAFPFRQGVIEDNTISCNGRAGIAILSGGDPLVCSNKIHDGMDSGVLISERGRGRVEENDIYGNRRAGVAILKEGAPLVKRNRIHDGRDSGVLVCENGKGSVVDNDIFANQMAGVAIGRGGASRVTGNVIRDGNGGSLCLSAHSRGLISANVIHHHPRAAMQVPEGLLPEVKEHNLIRYASEENAANGAANGDDEATPMDIVTVQTTPSPRGIVNGA